MSNLDSKYRVMQKYCRKSILYIIQHIFIYNIFKNDKIELNNMYYYIINY